MKKQDYHTSITVSSKAEEAFISIIDVAKWWTENLEGNAKKMNNEFIVHFGQTFVTLKVAELIRGKKVVWHVTDCHKHWLKNKKEWRGTQVIWEISTKNEKTQIDFTHLGLVSKLECYGACENAWTDYLHNSLMDLVTSGKGRPEPKEKAKPGIIS